nr:unnamed protein product [Digitaria exilis]
MGFPTPFLKLKAPNPPIGGYPRPSSTAAAKRRLTTLRCALNSENNVPSWPLLFTQQTSSYITWFIDPLIHYIAASTYPGVTIAEQGDWEACVRASSAVVNLAGMPISTRWSPEIKREIKQSRLSVTSKVVKYINHAENADAQPSVFVSATAIGYYGTSEIHSFDESSPSGNDYLAEVRFISCSFNCKITTRVCREWEATARQVNQDDVRLVLLRIGVVLGKDGGALGWWVSFNSICLFSFPISPRPRFSWIHLDDLVNLIYESLINPAYKGVINGTAPNPVRLSELCQRLGQVVGRPSWLPVPEFALKAVLGEGATVVLEGQKVLPVKAKDLGFSYRYPYVEGALKAIAQDL